MKYFMSDNAEQGNKAVLNILPVTDCMCQVNDDGKLSLIFTDKLRLITMPEDAPNKRIDIFMAKGNDIDRNRDRDIRFIRKNLFYGCNDTPVEILFLHFIQKCADSRRIFARLFKMIHIIDNSLMIFQ